MIFVEKTKEFKYADATVRFIYLHQHHADKPYQSRTDNKNIQQKL